jgi:hypothetical protein
MDIPKLSMQAAMERDRAPEAAPVVDGALSGREAQLFGSFNDQQHALHFVRFH